MGRQRTVLATVMAVVAFGAAYQSHVRPWMYTWGAEPGETETTLPGDELVSAGMPRTTRAVTIDAAVEQVWPWLAQIGENRGGFYSYAWLERAVGADVHNTDVIHAEWQDLYVGDTIWLARRFGPSARQVVAAVDQNSHLALVSPADFERLERGERALGAWVFVLQRKSGWTRMLVRGSGGAVGRFWFDVPHFIMEQKMMRGIRARAERMRCDAVRQFASGGGTKSRPVTVAPLCSTGDAHDREH